MKEELAVPPNRKVHFLLLGPIEAYAEGSDTPLDLGPDHEQRLLVVLLGADRKSVSRDRLIHAVWDDDPPKDATDAVWRLVYKLRTRLRKAGLGDVLIGNRATYRLDVPPEQVDLHRFRAMSTRAHGLIGRADQEAGELLEQALKLCRGVPLAGLNGTWIEGFRHTIIEEQHMVETALYELAVRLGKSREVVPRLMTLYREHPNDESVAWLYMHALYRSGRQSEALAVFREVGKYLNDTIGGDSMAALSGLHQRMLTGDPELMSPDAVTFPFGRAAAEASSAGSAESQGEAGDGDTRDDGENGEHEAASKPRPHGTSITAHEIGISNVFHSTVSVGNDLNFNA